MARPLAYFTVKFHRKVVGSTSAYRNVSNFDVFPHFLGLQILKVFGVILRLLGMPSTAARCPVPQNEDA